VGALVEKCPFVGKLEQIWGFEGELQAKSLVLLRVDLNPLQKKATSSEVRNVMIDFPTLFLKWYQKDVKVRFSYLLWHDNFCKGPRTLRKFSQKCQKIAGC